ncbi:MAG: neutral zinc metallopeptidase [Pseudomonadota bacterium]|jgi:predicted metalloprotease|nr:MAG: flagellar biosynthesis protein FlgM [Pseudomonadota bacterium]
MRWRDLRRSQNVRDLRGRSGGTGLKFGLGGLVVLAAAYFLGIDPRLVEGLLDTGGGAATSMPASTLPPSDDAGAFTAAVLGSTEDVWSALFAREGSSYQPPILVLFDNPQRTGCGTATSALGPFYCPADQGVYIDLNFFHQLAGQFGGPQDAARDDSFAKAYVIAHEVGHHVQTVTGISGQVRGAQGRAGEAEGNALQVRMELQADCLAGVWAHHARERLTVQDVRDAMVAAAAVGDDMIQKKTQGYVVPESFTHGSAAQRQRWFMRGFDSGEMNACDTFGADPP